MAFSIRNLTDGAGSANAAENGGVDISAIVAKVNAGVPLTSVENMAYMALTGHTSASVLGNAKPGMSGQASQLGKATSGMGGSASNAGAGSANAAENGGQQYFTAGSANSAENHAGLPGTGAYQPGSSNSAEHDVGIQPDQTPTTSPFLQSLFGGLGDKLTGALGNLQKSIGQNAPQQQDSGSYDNTQQYQTLPDLTLPGAPNISVAPKDFSDQANKMAADAYKPTYAALDTGRTNAKSQYDMADKIVEGLYQKLAGDTSARQADTKQSYAKAGQDQKANAQQTQHDIGQGYQSAQSDEANLLKSLGIGAAAPGALNAATQASGFQQGQAAQASGAQAANLNAQGAAQNDFQNDIGSADATQGKVDRQGLVSSLGDVLSGYDSQQQNVAGQQAQQALSIGQGLTSQDLSAQTANAGYQEQGYQDQVSQAQSKYNAQVANMQYHDQQVAAQVKAQQDQAAAAAAAQQQAFAQQQQEWQNNFDVNKFQVGSAIDQGNLSVAQQNAASGAEHNRWLDSPNNPNNMLPAPKPAAPAPVNPDIASQVTSKIAAVTDPQTAIDMFNLVQGAYATPNSSASTSKTALIQYAMMQAKSEGKDANLAATAAAAYADQVGLK